MKSILFSVLVIVFFFSNGCHRDAPAAVSRSGRATTVHPPGPARPPARPTRIVAQVTPRAEPDTGDDDEAPEKPKKRGPLAPVAITLVRGESMGLYGRWSGVAMKDLYRGSGLRWNERLQPGRQITLQLSESERRLFETARKRFHDAHEARYVRRGTCRYRVRSGDNGWRIARRMRVPLAVLERLNQGRDLSRLKRRQRIQVPCERRPPGES